jgi:hypothetical protein
VISPLEEYEPEAMGGRRVDMVDVAEGWDGRRKERELRKKDLLTAT